MHWFCIVFIIISYVHFSELQIRQAFSCPRPILILNLETLLFRFDKDDYDLNFNMHVLWKYDLILKYHLWVIDKLDKCMTYLKFTKMNVWDDDKYNTKSMHRIDWINGMIWLGYCMAGIMWHLNKHCKKKYEKKMLMLDYHSVQCS
jgi:hypothetical protein